MKSPATYHMRLGTLVDVMRGDYHSRVTILRNVHQMIPDAVINKMKS